MIFSSALVKTAGLGDRQPILSVICSAHVRRAGFADRASHDDVAGEAAPAKQPIGEIKRLADQALAKLDRTFDAMYSSIGRPSIPPERLLKAQLLIAPYSVRSERQFPDTFWRWSRDARWPRRKCGPTPSCRRPRSEG